MSRVARLVLALLAAGVMSCSSRAPAVRSWERDALARPDMAWAPDELEALHRDHVFFSKEGSLPGGGAGGGGCGCN